MPFNNGEAQMSLINGKMCSQISFFSFGVCHVAPNSCY